LTLGEDSGLEVKALDNRPGVYSSRYSGKGATDKKNNNKLLRQLRGVPLRKRQARYVCSVAISDANKLLGVVEGTCRGLITTKEMGGAGFGYDPIFLIPKFDKTFGQLGEKIKHRMSHRYKAFVKARQIILGCRRKSNPKHP
jgi:XTP/dITP diphosphohydrolase